MNLRHLIYIIVAGVITTFAACGNKTEEAKNLTPQEPDDSIVGDSMFYGLVCDGTSDTVIVVYPMDGGDPVTYSCIDAKRAGKIIGKPTIGDWVGLVICPDDAGEADMVINLDQLKGTWTYPVMPQMKDFKHLSKRMQKRMEREALQEMPDSEKAMYMVPREYGFSLKRSHVAQAVGRVYTSSTLEDDSPVEYPEVKNYKKWYAWNGRLILISGERTLANMPSDHKPKPNVKDTFDFVSLSDDSLVLELHSQRYAFHRKANVLTVNAKAQKAAQKAAEKKL